MKIAVVVQGRFHAFDLVRGLVERGNDVTIFTNYPAYAMERFGVPRARAVCAPLHGLASRVSDRFGGDFMSATREEWVHRWFGRWAASKLAGQRWDVVHAWSGVTEEIALGGRANIGRLQVLRGSAHIRAQARLVAEEESRVGVRLDKPSSWRIAREEREYDLADRVVVLSTFSYETCVAEGVRPEKVQVLRPGADVRRFRPAEGVLRERCRRILSGQPLRMLTVGMFSFRKGIWDLDAAIRRCRVGRFRFRFVGAVAAEAKGFARRLGANRSVEFSGKQPQAGLPKFYDWADVFVLPTIEDGYQTVLSQAAAAGLPILTTPNGAGRDLVREGENGWIIPIRDAAAIQARLEWCDENRAQLASLVERNFESPPVPDWNAAARDFERICAVPECASRDRS